MRTNEQGVLLRTCTNCRKEKDINEFRESDTSKDGITHQCFDCLILRKKWRKVYGIKSPVVNKPKKEQAKQGKKKLSKKKRKKQRAEKRALSQSFYKSREWRSLRFDALKKYGAKCCLCGASPETGAVMHVDHIKPRSKRPDLALDLSNLQILCADCNLGKSNRDDTDFRK